MEDKKIIIVPEGDEFLKELCEKQVTLTLFTKNGVQLHGHISALYANWLAFTSDNPRFPDSGKPDYIRYDAISTLKRLPY